MINRSFLYMVKHMGRQSRIIGISFGVIHSDSEEHATMLLMEKMGNNAYGFRLMEVTDRNGEGYLGIPSGELLGWD